MLLLFNKSEDGMRVGNLNKLEAPKAKHLSKMLSLGRVLTKAYKEAAPIQNGPVCIQQGAEEPSVRSDFATVFSMG